MDGTYRVNGYTIYPSAWQSAPLGFISGLQYDDSTFGSCFYATVDTLNFVEYFEQDVANFLSEGDFYQLFVYDPVRFLSNYLALYE